MSDLYNACSKFYKNTERYDVSQAVIKRIVYEEACIHSGYSIPRKINYDFAVDKIIKWYDDCWKYDLSDVAKFIETHSRACLWAVMKGMEK